MFYLWDLERYFSCDVYYYYILISVFESDDVWFSIVRQNRQPSKYALCSRSTPSRELYRAG